MSFDPQNRVFTNVKKYVLERFPNVHIENRNTQNPTSLPALMISMIDSPETALDLDDGNVDEPNAIFAAFEIQANSNISVTEARQIIMCAADAMRKMSFQRTYGPSFIASSYQRTYGSSVIAAQSDQNIHRMVARFERILCSLDDVPKFE